MVVKSTWSIEEQTQLVNTMIKARQVHYTSCHYGISGQQSGFQVRAMSNGVSQVELNEIMKRSGYKRPQGEQEHPVAFRYYVLSSGKYALTRVVYAGTDYSGREGNLFAHTLVFDELDIWPSSLFKWEEWKSHLEEGEDEEKPEPLPVVELNITQTPMYEFIKTEEQEDRLKTMLTAIFLSQSSKRTLILRGNPQQQSQWIACVHQCFPLSIAHSLEFSTYEYTPTRLPTIAVTVEGTDISLDVRQRQYQFYVFDDISGQDSKLPDDEQNLMGKDYAELIVHLRSNPSRLHKFFDFTALFKCRKVDHLLGNVARLYSLSLGVFDYPPTVLAESAEFAIQSEHIFYDNNVTNHLIQSLREQAFEKCDLADWSLYARFLGKAAFITKLSSHKHELMSIWQQMFIRNLRKGNLVPHELQQVREDIEQAMPEVRKYLLASLLEPVVLQAVAALLPFLCGDRAVQTIQIIASTVEQIGRTPAFVQIEVLNLISVISKTDDCLRSTLPALLRQITDAKVLCIICQHIYTLNTERKKALVNIIKNLKLLPDFDIAVKQCLPLDLLLQELEVMLDSQQAQVDTFIKYRLNVLDQRDGINWAFIDRIIVQLLETSNDIECLKLTYHLLERDELREIISDNPALLLRCIKLVNADIKLELGVIQSSLVELLILVRKHNISLYPNKIELLEILNTSVKPVVPANKIINVLNKNIGHLNKADYETFVMALLNTYITSHGTKNICIEIREHELLLGILFSISTKAKDDRFKNIYLTWLESKLNLISNESCLTDFIAMWLTISAKYIEEELMKSMEEKVMPLLAYALAHHPNKNTSMTTLNKIVNKDQIANERYRNLINLADQHQLIHWSKLNPFKWFLLKIHR